jgi:hypothetical protein
MPILLINFKLNVSSAEYRKIAQSVVQAIADVPGLVWKVWLLNEPDGEAGGIYLFQDEQSYCLSRQPDYSPDKEPPAVARNQREAVRDNTGTNRRYSWPYTRAGNYLAGDSLPFMAFTPGVLKGGF